LVSPKFPQARPRRDTDERRPGVRILAPRRAGQPLAVALDPGRSPQDGTGRCTTRLPTLPWEQ
jgi:hypothetical protein